ncbi:MAG: glycosyl hydrolase family 8 [Cytophagaceae bacterium]
MKKAILKQKRFLFIKIYLSLFFLISTQYAHSQINTPAGAAVPFGTNTDYAYGTMPTNLPTGGAYGHAQDAADAYNSWKANFTQCCGDVCRVNSSGGAAGIADVVSEAIAYGMLLAAYAADKNFFDGLWRYYRQSMNCNGFMHWGTNGCPPNGFPGQNGAADADVDVAMALIIASRQWPDATVPFNYAAEAEQLIGNLMDFQIDHVTTPRYELSNGDGWMGGCGVAPRTGSNNCRNPSYMAPGYFQCYRDFSPNTDALWTNAMTAGRNHWTGNAHATTGLPSNWSRPGGSTAGACSGSGTPTTGFGYDAIRAPWRQGVDAMWYGNAGVQTLINRQVDWWIAGGGGVNGGVARIADNFNYNGTGGGGAHNSTFVSMIGAQAIGSSNQAWVNAMYQETVNVNSPNYFNQSLRTLGLFTMTGQFWNPCDVSTTPSNITVSITSPSTGTVFDECDGTIAITADASTTDGSITGVEFFVDGVSIGIDNSAPYSITWNPPGPGNYAITAEATSSVPESRTSSAANIEVIKGVFQAASPPVIDGTIDAVWGIHSAGDAPNLIRGTVANDADLSAEWKMMYDNNFLYVLAVVTDDARKSEGGANVWEDDGIEIYIDIGNDKNGTYGANDYRYAFRWNDPVVYEAQHGNTAGVQYAQSNTTDGYIMEIAIPWGILGGTPTPGTLMGFDFHVNDDDPGTAGRDGKIAWNAIEDEVWNNPSLMGTVQFGTVACSDLPVELIQFEAKSQGSIVLLSWITASEKNNSHFVVERSADGKEFEPLSRLTGNGTTSSLSEYNYTDNNPLGGTSYYRLVQYDYDGTESHSPVRNVEKGVVLKAEAWPNPFSNHFLLKTAGTGLLNITITDMQGRTLEHKTVDAGSQIQLGQSLGSGVYIINIQNEQKIINLRIVKI